MTLPNSTKTCILDAVLDAKENVWTISIIAVVNQYCSLSQQLTVSLERHIDGGVEQGMAWAQERCDRPILRSDKVLLKCDALVA